MKGFLRLDKIATRLAVIFSAILVFSCFLILLGSFLVNRAISKESLASNLKNIVATAALNLSGTPYKDFHSHKATATEEWKSQRRFLDQVREVNHLDKAHLYTFRIPDPSDPSVLQFAVMLHDSPFVGDLYAVPAKNLAHIKTVLHKGKPVSTDIYKDDHGIWISAYAPIFDKNGKVQGILEADYRMDSDNNAYLSKLKENLTPILVILVLVILLGTTFIALISRTIAKPIEEMVHLSHEISQGNWDRPIPQMSWSELQELADAFETMRNEIQAQVGNLKRFNKELEHLVEERTLHLREANREITAINTMITSVNERIGIEELLGKTIDSAKDLIPINCLILYLFPIGAKDPTQEEGPPNQSDRLIQFIAEVDREGTRHILRKEVRNQALREDLTSLSTPQSPPHFHPLADYITPNGEGASMLHPLVVDGNLFGMMLVAKEQKQPYNSREKDIFARFAEQVAGGIQKSQMIESLSQLNHELHQAQRRLQQQTKARIAYHETHDDLTGLGNRKLFLEKLLICLANMSFKNGVGAIILLGLDRFKTINETMGPKTGDFILQEIAARLSLTADKDQVLARIGGDLFAVLLPDVHEPDQAVLIAERIRNEVALPIGEQQQVHHLTCSMGFAILGEDGTTPEALLKNAETAMHRAKEAGGDKILGYNHTMSAEIVARMNMEKRLRFALENDQFQLYYQPQVDLTTDEVIGVEALVRWIDPELGFVSPSQFIPLAESTGLIVPLGNWIINQALCDRKRWQDQGLLSFKVAINLSARQFQQEALVSSIAQLLQQVVIDPDLIEFEITESAAMADVDTTISILNQFREMGLNLAIDDFGTGYSSLNYLKKFALSKLKIDRGFVTNIVSDKQDAVIVRTIINLAHSLGLKVIAEGVEDEAQLAYLRQEGCDEIQGYYFARPLQEKDLIDFFLTRAPQSLVG